MSAFVHRCFVKQSGLCLFFFFFCGLILNTGDSKTTGKNKGTIFRTHFHVFLFFYRPGFVVRKKNVSKCEERGKKRENTNVVFINSRFFRFSTLNRHLTGLELLSLSLLIFLDIIFFFLFTLISVKRLKMTFKCGRKIGSRYLLLSKKIFSLPCFLFKKNCDFCLLCRNFLNCCFVLTIRYFYAN